MQRAIQQFCLENELDTATEAQVRADVKGIEYYASAGLKLNARSPYNQCLQRALKYEPEKKEMVGILLEPFRKKFMVSYCMYKNFDFVTKTRDHSIQVKNERIKAGRFITLSQVAQKLGGWQDPAAKAQTLYFQKMCKSPELKDLT